MGAGRVGMSGSVGVPNHSYGTNLETRKVFSGASSRGARPFYGLRRSSQPAPILPTGSDNDRLSSVTP